METVLLIARVLLAVVFALAGLAKLADRTGTRQAMAGFGVPTALVTPLALLLPLAELTVAVALIPPASAWWAALGALALLLLFIAAMAVNLARGRTPDCHCFGQLHSAPIGRATLARNAVLALMAGSIVWQGRIDAGPSAVSWLGNLTGLELVVLVGALAAIGLLALQGALLLQLLGQNGRLLLRLEELETRVAGGVAPTRDETTAAPAGLPVDAPAPAFRAVTPDGQWTTLDDLRASAKPVVLVFTDPDCGPCNALLPDVGRWQRALADRVTLALISRGDVEANRAKHAGHGLTTVLVQQDREVADAYQVAGTPSAVVIRPDGTIAGALAQGAEEIRALMARAMTYAQWPGGAVHGIGNGHAHHNGHAHGVGGETIPLTPVSARIGDPAPALQLPDLSGTPVDLAQFRGRPTVVLFWNPGCGFCQQMLPDLKEWEANPPAGAPTLLAVSAGSVADNQALQLRAPITLDPDFRVGRAFGATGTPSAVLVDDEGRVASPVAVGGPQVLALLQRQAPHAAIEAAVVPADPQL